MWCLWTMLAVSTASAEPLAAQVQAVRAEMTKGELEAASKRLQEVYLAAPSAEEIVDAQTLGEILYYQGLIPRLMEVERPEDLDNWRDALVVFPGLVWDKEILESRDQQAVFEALRGEVEQRPAIPTGVPEARGEARMYVDGVEHLPKQAIRSGQHFVQVACPGDEMVGKWTRFVEPVSWLSLCSKPVDITVVPAPIEEESLGFGMEEEDPRGGPEPLPLSVVVVAKPPTFSERWKKTLLLGAGGTALVSGGLYVSALVSRGKYDNVDNTDIATQADLDALRGRTNTQVTLSITFASASVGMATVAAFSGRW